MSELGERWKLRRAQQMIDLSNRAQVEQTMPTQLQAVVAEKGRRDVTRVTTLIERKRDAMTARATPGSPTVRSTTSSA